MKGTCLKWPMCGLKEIGDVVLGIIKSSKNVSSEDNDDKVTVELS